MLKAKFEKQLKQGHKYELEALKYLVYDEYEHDKGYNKYYDLIITHNDIKIKVEVKSDRQASVTGNLCIEYEYNNKPSGLNITEAELFIYFIVYEDRDECYLFKTEELKKLCIGKKQVRGGDGYKSKCYLLNKKYLTDYIIKKK